MKPVHRRGFCRTGLVLLGAPLAGARAAEAFPSRPITLIVPFAPGSGTDVSARAVAEVMQRELKVPVVVDNRPGANAMIGSALAAKARPDGYTLLVGNVSTHSANPFLFRKLTYSPDDLVAVGQIIVTAAVLLGSADGPARSVADVVALVKSRPGKLNFAAPNSTSLISTEMFLRRIGGTAEIVRLNSGSQALVEVVSGRIDFIFGDLASSAPLRQQGRLRALGIAGPQRASVAPEVPTLAEAGVAGVECESWSGIVAPRGTPAEVIRTLNASINLALRDEGVRAVLARSGLDARPGTPEQFAAFIDAQYRHWQEMTTLVGYQPE